MKFSKFLSIVWVTFRDTFKDAGWAPVAVMMLHTIVVKMGVRERCDHLLHFLGGLSICYFLYRAIQICEPILGALQSPARYLLAFTTACTVAVFWEFGEFASDIYLRTHIQFSVSETLYDLIFGALGAICCLLIVRFVEILQKRAR